MRVTEMLAELEELEDECSLTDQDSIDNARPLIKNL